VSEDSDPESQSDSMRECEVPGNNRGHRDFVVGYSSRITIFRFFSARNLLSLSGFHSPRPCRSSISVDYKFFATDATVTVWC